MVYYTGKPIEKGIQTTSHKQNRLLICKQRFSKDSKTEQFTYTALLNIKKRWFLSFITERHNSLLPCHTFKSYKVQSWKAAYISRRRRIAEKDNNCVNFWFRKSLGKLNQCQPAKKPDRFSIFEIFYAKVKFLS